MKRSSIKDIAKLAGVSIATVSYILNNKVEKKISAETRTKILKIVNDINYVPNKIAKSLKSNKTKLLGLIVADISNDYYSEIARKLEDKALKLGYTIIIGSSDENPEKFKNFAEIFSQQQVDGMIVAPVSGSEETLQNLIQMQYPVVAIDRYIKNISIPSVTIDNKSISATAANLILKHGFERVVYIGYDTALQHLLDRQYGFDEVMLGSNKQVELIHTLVGLDNIKRDVNRALDEVLSKMTSKTALYFSSNKLAMVGLAYLVKKNIKVPEEVAVIAFDETNAYDLFPVGMTYIQQPIEAIVQNAMYLLDKQIHNYVQNDEMIVLRAELIEKQSVSF